MSLPILYQDDWIIAINKPAGYLVHPADHPQEEDLVAMKILRDQIGQPVNPIHRLDRPTSGVLLFGLDKPSTRQLIESHPQFVKRYLAISNGQMHTTAWECSEPLQKKENAPFKEALTTFKLLETVSHPALPATQNSLHLIQATPHTGRFHQIRRHLLHDGLPIVGDYRYAGMEVSEKLNEHLKLDTRMLLQAKSLLFPHPITKEMVEIKAPLDPYFKKLFPNEE